MILATGSISSNADLVRRFYGTDEYRDVHIMAQLPHNTGDGLIMAEEIGAAQGRIGTLFIGPHNHYPKASELIGMLMRRAQPIKVNQNGERFVDESIPFEEEFGWMMSLSVDCQPGKKSFTLMDQNYIAAVKEGRDYLPARYDTGCMLDAPPKMGGPICPVEKAPYYVILGRSGIDTCLGGLKIDNRQRVLDQEGHVIPGLYAAGVMCSGWFNDSYCYFGSEMSFTIYSGRTSGAEAAQLLKGEE